LLNQDEYKTIKNVTLPAEGGTTQIDHIIVSEHGVFVIETKNMKGWIYGLNCCLDGYKATMGGSKNG